MGRLLSERTSGRLGIRIYAGGQLGAERDTLEITTFGGLDMNRVFLSPLNSIEPDTTIPSLPFLFHSKEHMRRALDGAPGRAILDTLAPHGLIGLCYYDSGERSFYNTQAPDLHARRHEGHEDPHAELRHVGGDDQRHRRQRDADGSRRSLPVAGAGRDRRRREQLAVL